MNVLASNRFGLLRRAAKLSLEEAADFLMCPLNTVVGLEDGSLLPDISSILALESLSVVQNEHIEQKHTQFTLGSSKLKIFSFFAGAGFLDLGFEKAGYDVEFVNENHIPFLDAYKFSRKKMSFREPAFRYSSESITDFSRDEAKRFFDEAVNLCKSNNSLVGFIGLTPYHFEFHKTETE